MKKKTDRSTCCAVCAIVGLAIGSVACLICSNCMSSNAASIWGGVLSVAATTFLGIIAVWQNKKYKEIADEKSKQAEELMFTPECRLFSVSTYEHPAVQKQKAIIELGRGQSYFLQFFTLNLMMIDVIVEEILCYEKANDKHRRVFPRNSILFSNSGFTMLKDSNCFEIEMIFPSEFLCVDTICSVMLSYKNIYNSVVHKTVEFERAANGNIIITKQDRAILMGKTEKDTYHVDMWME